MHRPDLIISGGQTGADLGGLVGAKRAGIPTGGVAPKGWKTENGPAPWLGSEYGLVESESADYDVRTAENVAICDAGLLICQNFESPGSKLTKKLFYLAGKPRFAVVFAPKLDDFPYLLVEDLRHWLKMQAPSVLFIGGNRESVARGIQNFTQNLLVLLFK